MQPNAEIPVFLALLSGPEVVTILAIILVLFGARHLDGLRRGLGRGGRIFRDEVDKMADDAGRTVGYNFSKPVYEALTHDNQDVEFHDRRELRPINFRLWKKAKSFFGKFCQFIRRLMRVR